MMISCVRSLCRTRSYCYANFSNNLIFIAKIRFSYGSKIPFFGSPFVISKTIYMRCSQDGDYKPSTDKNVSMAEIVNFSNDWFCNISDIAMFLQNGDSSTQRKRLISQPTKKKGCKAFLHITYLLVFRNIKVQNRQGEKREVTFIRLLQFHRRTASRSGIGFQASEKIKADLAEYVRHCETRLLIELSTTKEHNHPPTTENQIIHPSLKSEIYRLVANNVKLIPNIRSHLLEIVDKMIKENKIPQPDINNHCFYPPNEVIRYHTYMAKFSLKKENLDELTVSRLIELWKEKCDDKFYFQPLSGNHKLKPKLLFCHQTKWQEYLLNHYGNSITILDSAYKVTDYSFALYFLIVKTNKSFVPVGTFVLNSPQEVAVSEALNVFRQWSPNWYPKYWICGHVEFERNSVQAMFPNSILNICSHRALHTWKTWLSQENTKESSDELYKLWEALMFSKTEEEFARNESLMRNNKTYKKSAAAETYFYKIWYPLREKWVLAYHTQEFYVFMSMNDGVKTGTEFFSHNFLNQYEDCILSNVLTIILERYLPECLYDYRDFNVAIDIDSIPEDLIGRPVHIVEHILQRYQAAECEYEGATIVSTAINKFMLKSSTQQEWYQVDLVDVNCTCDDFQKWRYPCIHMCAIFVFTEWNLNSLAEWYLNSVFLKSDEKFFKLLNNLPIWYFDERKRSEDIRNPDNLPKKKRLVVGE